MPHLVERTPPTATRCSNSAMKLSCPSGTWDVETDSTSTNYEWNHCNATVAGCTAKLTTSVRTRCHLKRVQT